MSVEPEIKRAVAFFDGQNLFDAVKNAFGYKYPNYDPAKLAKAVCVTKGWTLKQARFYTGVPSADDNQAWNSFFSHDQDLSEVADEVRALGREPARKIARPGRTPERHVRE
jgi:hypothetical protein